jgi:predicted small integral membrane protein
MDSLERANFVQSGDIMSALRAIQLMGVAAIGALTGLACLNNLMDYNSNFALVQHVLSMDTTFPEGTLRWRAITSPALHHAAYWLIIATEGVAGALCLVGAYKMLVARNASTNIFNESKNVALWGLGIALALYLVGFMIIGAEWFAMWQSQRWDGRQPAFRILMCISVVILIVLQEDKKSVPQRDHQPPAKKGGRADEVID